MRSGGRGARWPALVFSVATLAAVAALAALGSGSAGSDEDVLVLDAPGAATAHVTAAGAGIRVGGHAVTLRAAAVGRGAERAELTSGAPPRRVGDEVRIERGRGVVEWWRAEARGLEHGVTLGVRPAGAGALAVEIEVGGELSARSISDDAVALLGAGGRRVASYGHLVVLDATEARVPAHMEARGDRIVVVIDDAGARYPLVVDPLLVPTEEATLLSTDGALNDGLGGSVALSSGASLAIVGVSSDDTAAGTDAGSARTYERTGMVWTAQATLLGSGAAMGDRLGAAVSLSSDGSLALVGAPGDDTIVGADVGTARVFVRTGAAWSEEATLSAPDGAVDDDFGYAVAMSGDGLRALVGAARDDDGAFTDVGSARVFVRSGTSWTEESILRPEDVTGGLDRFGTSVAIAVDGSRALVGEPGDDTTTLRTGSARVFVRSGSVWTAEATLATADGQIDDGFGAAVSLSSDASRALVGAWRDGTPRGAMSGSARVFVRAGTTWTEEATLLPADGGPGDQFGVSVSLSADGSRALVGARGHNTTAGPDAGSGYVFVRTGTTWAQDAVLRASDAEMGDRLGSSVAISADGTRAATGAPYDLTAGVSGAGSARIFRFRAADAVGTACADASTCVSGFCVDGVCCEAACGDGASDCQACSAALTGGADGACAPLSATLAPTVTCRTAAQPCDAPEVCTSTSTTCPTDGFLPPSTVCAPPVTPCDAEERCTGASAACPTNAAAIAGTICRDSAGACDPAEACDGTSFTCPADARSPSGAACGGTAGSCSTPGMCDGTLASCVGGTPLVAGTVCLAALPGNPCDVDDLCDGTSDACRARFADATTACGPTATGACDAPDHCAGGSGACVATFLAGVECRASSGGCDPAEVCAGASAACPPDAVSPVGTVCRASSDPACDPVESCDGTAASCPADVSRCVVPDAGPGDAGAIDAGAIDGGGPPAVLAGCGCRSSAHAPLGGLALALGLAALSAARRAASPRRRSRCSTRRPG